MIHILFPGRNEPQKINNMSHFVFSCASIF